jgi:class 3 adenylate cyclase
VAVPDVDVCPLPEDPLLAEMASSLRDAGHWAEIVDPGWRIVYTTDELRFAQGFMVKPARLTLGMHMFGEECITAQEQSPAGGKVVDVYREVLASIGDWVLADTPGGHDALRSIVDPRLSDVVDQLATTHLTVASSSVHGGIGLGTARPAMDLTVTRIRDADGRLAGTAMIQKPHVSMSMLATLGAMHDPQHLARMQSVASAGRRPAAILFADLEGSSSLARRSSTERYFALGRRMTRAADRCVVEAGGITGRHVGDGVVAFFVAENLGSESAAAAGAISAARTLTDAMTDIALRSDLDREDLEMRFGLHWGSTMYIGLISSVGRTEVTALGDEVNECARIEACATGGRTLASKSLIERLSPDAAAALDLDTNRIAYIQLGELSTATDKARRDAPSIAVCEL